MGLMMFNHTSFDVNAKYSLDAVIAKILENLPSILVLLPM